MSAIYNDSNMFGMSAIHQQQPNIWQVFNLLYMNLFHNHVWSLDHDMISSYTIACIHCCSAADISEYRKIYIKVAHLSHMLYSRETLFFFHLGLSCKCRRSLCNSQNNFHFLFFFTLVTNSVYNMSAIYK